MFTRRAPSAGVPRHRGSDRLRCPAVRATRLSTALLVAALLLTGCGGSDDADTTAPESTAAPTDAPDGDEAPTPQQVPEEPDDECRNDLVVTGSEDDDGPVSVAMAIADDGPHPANTVDSDSILSGAIATYELEADPQFGLGIPVGVPDVPDDGLIYVFTLTLTDTAGTIAAGSTFTDAAEGEGDATGRIANHGLYSGTSGRINPLGPTTIEINEITDEWVCGTITSVGETDIQTFPTLNGTFAAERVQALEAEG